MICGCDFVKTEWSVAVSVLQASGPEFTDLAAFQNCLRQYLSFLVSAELTPFFQVYSKTQGTFHIIKFVEEARNQL